MPFSEALGLIGEDKGLSVCTYTFILDTHIPSLYK